MPPLDLDTVEQTREQLLEDRAGSRPAPRAKTKRA
jgi:hypothetical protein